MGNRTMLTERKGRQYHYYLDTLDRHQGEAKQWHSNGQILRHMFYLNNEPHGEQRHWWNDGTLSQHHFWQRGNDITDEVSKELKDPLNPTDIERMMIKLKWGIDLC